MITSWIRRRDAERRALIQCARALAFSYGGTRRPPADEPEHLALWEAMHAAYAALGVSHTRDVAPFDSWLHYLLAEPRDAFYSWRSRAACRLFGRHGPVCAGRVDHPRMARR